MRLHSLYQYSLQYFLEIFNTVLTHNSNLKDVKDPQQRLKIVARDLFYLTYYRLARGMLHDDRIVLALLLSKIYLKGFTAAQSFDSLDFDLESEFKSLMSPYNTGLLTNTGLTQRSLGRNNDNLNPEQNEALMHLSKITAFRNLDSNIDTHSSEFSKWIESSNPEQAVPEMLWSTKTTELPVTSNIDLNLINIAMKRLLLIKAFRPDKFVAVAEIFVKSIFGYQTIF